MRIGKLQNTRIRRSNAGVLASASSTPAEAVPRRLQVFFEKLTTPAQLTQRLIDLDEPIRCDLEIFKL